MTLVEEYVRAHTLERVYDDVLIPALLLAWQDRKQRILLGEDETFILQATQDIVAELEALIPEPAAGVRSASVYSATCSSPLVPNKPRGSTAAARSTGAECFGEGGWRRTAGSSIG